MTQIPNCGAKLTSFLPLSHGVSQLFNFTSCASASTGAAKCVKHMALLEYNAMLCGQRFGHSSCIIAFGAQIIFARMTFLHSASHVAAQLTSALQQLVCVMSLQICEWGTFVYSGGAAREESIAES